MRDVRVAVDAGASNTVLVVVLSDLSWQAAEGVSVKSLEQVPAAVGANWGCLKLTLAVVGVRAADADLVSAGIVAGGARRAAAVGAFVRVAGARVGLQTPSSGAGADGEVDRGPGLVVNTVGGDTGDGDEKSDD